MITFDVKLEGTTPQVYVSISETTSLMQRHSKTLTSV